jgi:hypothetical protein
LKSLLNYKGPIEIPVGFKGVGGASGLQVLLWCTGGGRSSDVWRLAAHVPTALAAAAAPLLAQDGAQVALGGAKEVRRSAIELLGPH